MTHVYQIQSAAGKFQVCADHELTHEELQMEAYQHSRQTAGYGQNIYRVLKYGTL